jgi:hypothetical protein
VPISPQYKVEGRSLASEDRHPHVKSFVTFSGDFVDPPGLPRSAGLIEGANQTIALKFGQGTVDAGSINTPKAKIIQGGDHGIAIGGMFGQKEKDRGVEKVTGSGNGELAARVGWPVWST